MASVGWAPHYPGAFDPTGVNGLRMLGILHDAVVFLIEQLSGAKHCRNYKFRFHKPEEANEPSKMFLRFVVGSPCSLAPPFIWLVQLWAQGLTWKQGPISLDWYFCHLVSSSLHLYWEAQDSFEPMHTDLYRSCLPRELGMPFANDWMR